MPTESLRSLCLHVMSIAERAGFPFPMHWDLITTIRLSFCFLCGYIHCFFHICSFFCEYQPYDWSRCEGIVINFAEWPMETSAYSVVPNVYRLPVSGCRWFDSDYR
ncbi:hypothetical protein KP509_34G060200 [Ceratopteris richardii]|uniref:Uncharacterized protein n=1 Tax=Ceratopteris richardii TaxID=49495 RepID=A0A8T2QLT2_CERRI|nr:hypothetical protein KP509_34G060200 [Ceratopteris richardii]